MKPKEQFLDYDFQNNLNMVLHNLFIKTMAGLFKIFNERWWERRVGLDAELGRGWVGMVSVQGLSLVLNETPPVFQNL